MPKSSPRTARLLAGGVAVAAVAALAITVVTRGPETEGAAAADPPPPTAPATTPSSAAAGGAATATATTAAATATARPSGTKAGGNAGGDTAAGPCADVYLASAPSGAVVGRLCTDLKVKNKRPTGATVVFTSATDCTGAVRMRLSGIDTTYAEWAQHANVACSGGKATAKYTITVRIPSGTEVCGMLESEDRFSAALTCVPTA
jgi:hypothetical protein